MFFDVAVIGGGPAGAVVAAQLAKYGCKIALVDRSDSEFKIGETLPPSSRVLLHKLQLLDLLQDGSHLPCYGNQSAWGSSDLVNTDFIFDPHGAGWHLDRAQFDEQLRKEAERRGVRVFPRTRVVDVSRLEEKWVIPLGDEKQTVLKCDWMVDSTGRSRWLARRLKIKVSQYDSLIAVAAVFDTSGVHNDRDSRTLVESVPAGWWYTALLPGSRRIAVFFSDAGTSAAGFCGDQASFLRLLDETRHVKNRIAPNSPLLHGPLARPAESARLELLCGSNWLAVGDAAMSFDPLSSQGILSAIQSADAAAGALHRAMAGNRNALEEYSAGLHSEYDKYLRERERYYALEARWRDQPFWQ